MLVVYIREAHPVGPRQSKANERDGIKIEDPKTLAERERVARDFAAQFKVGLPILVDSIEDHAGRAYSAMPDRIYVIDAKGTIAYKGGPGPGGFKAAEVPRVLDQLLGTSIAAGLQLPDAKPPRENEPGADEKIDLGRVKTLYEKSKRGTKLTFEEQQYLDRALERLKKPGAPRPDARPDEVKFGPWKEQPQTGLTPLTEMTAARKYKGEDGGLYGAGLNEPPKEHRQAAQDALQRIKTLDATGKPAADGKIVFISLGMSNTAGEFMVFKEIADVDPQKSPNVQIVNCAVGGAGVRSWTQPTSRPWEEVEKRLKEAKVTPEQVQVAWIKHAEPMPDDDKEPLQYARQVKDDIARTIGITKTRFPNLRIAYLSSRIYGGYNAVGRRRVNPEPFAYETGFAVRWVIQDQINGKAHNLDPKKGAVVAPVLLWGPYLWADGINARQGDGLIWKREDFGQDGVHPTRDKGARKVADQLLKFLKTDPNAQAWFAKKS